jgi:hypothetical protein
VAILPSYNKFIYVHAFGSVVFMQENMDIKDGFTMVARTEVLRRNTPGD